MLRCLGNGQVQRQGLCGDLEPYLLNGHSVDGTLTLLALRGLVAFDLAGAVRMTSRGLQALTGNPRATYRVRRLGASLDGAGVTATRPSRRTGGMLAIR